MTQILILFCVFVALFNTGVFAQIDIPANLQRAYKNGTRTVIGTPGKALWQNSASYRIEAEINTQKNLLTGSADIIYHNDSPDTLKQVIFRLYQNLYTPGAPRFTQLPAEDLTEGITIQTVSVNGFVPQMSDKKSVTVNGTLMAVRLPKEAFIAPQSSIKIKTSWNFTITKNASLRQGRIDAHSYFIGYWYPQISVYDDIEGWDRTQFNGEAEFYNDFNSYDVSITVPNEYGVWATGLLQNPEELLSPDLFNRFKRAQTSPTAVPLITNSDLGKKVLYLNRTEKNIWKFKADKVTDFAFAVSKNHLWYASSPVCDKKSGTTTFLQSVLKPDDKFYDTVHFIAERTLEYFSTVFPAVPYPFPAMTVFNGRDDIGGGMEYPMIVNDPTYETFGLTGLVTTHEMAHQYFPFYMGTNERKYGWLDEGWAVTSTFELQTALDSTFDLRRGYVNLFNRTMGTELDHPLTTITHQMTGQPQQFATYNRSGLFFSMFREMIGKAKYDAALRNFIILWAGKRPTPYDYFFFMENELKLPLQDFFRLWCFENHTADLSIVSAVINNQGTLTITIQRKGILPVPITLIIHYKDGRKKKLTKEGFYWSKNEKEVTLEEIVEGIIERIELETVHIPDASPSDNSYIMPQ